MENRQQSSVSNSIEIPNHIAIILDGHRRYATSEKLSLSNSYYEGSRKSQKVLRWCEELGVNELSYFAFSIQNFNRNPNEQSAVFDVIEKSLYKISDDTWVHNNGVKINIIGSVKTLPETVKKAVKYARYRTGEYDSFKLNVAIGYGGRQELLNAVERIAKKVSEGTLTPKNIDEGKISSNLYNVSPVDLMIRTSGEKRYSGFLPWYGCGSEAVFFDSEVLFPEFVLGDLLNSIYMYNSFLK